MGPAAATVHGRRRLRQRRSHAGGRHAGRGGGQPQPGTGEREWAGTGVFRQGALCRRHRRGPAALSRHRIST